MRNKYTRVTKNRNAMVAVSDHRRHGHQDACAGRPFHPDYDRWTAPQQIAYEKGRLCVFYIQLANLAVPVWRSDVIRPRTYNKTVRLALELVEARIPG